MLVKIKNLKELEKLHGEGTNWIKDVASLWMKVDWNVNHSRLDPRQYKYYYHFSVLGGYSFTPYVINYLISIKDMDIPITIPYK